jgi:hypothetical protein
LKGAGWKESVFEELDVVVDEEDLRPVILSQIDIVRGVKRVNRWDMMFAEKSMMFVRFDSSEKYLTHRPSAFHSFCHVRRL